jgi:hypothetical protein
MPRSRTLPLAEITSAPALHDLLESDHLRGDLAEMSRIISGLSSRERAALRRRLVAIWGVVTPVASPAPSSGLQSRRRRSA